MPVLYVSNDLQHLGSVDDACVAGTTERHHRVISPSGLSRHEHLLADIAGADGVVFECASGVPSLRHVQAIDAVLRAGGLAWIYWPGETAVEVVDRERADDLRRLVARVRWMKRGLPIARARPAWKRLPLALRWAYRGAFPVRRTEILDHLTRLGLRACPVPLDLSPAYRARQTIPGVGVYLRLDFWNEDASDADVVNGLAAVTDRLVCLVTRERGGLGRDVILDPPPATFGEDAVVLAAAHYLPIVKAACQALKPTYIYERAAAGQSAGAELSQVLRIPYVVEYPGAEIAIREALMGRPPFYAQIYAKTDELVLRQAAVVIVRSSTLSKDLVARGIDGRRIVNVGPAADVGRELAAAEVGGRLAHAVSAQVQDRPPAWIDTGDPDKDQVQAQWNENPVGSHYARSSQPHTLDWFLEVERHRYRIYAPWMPQVMEFTGHRGETVLEIGAGLGTDLAQFAANGATVTDVDLAAGHLELAEENFHLRGLRGRFIHHDAESLPFDDRSFDLVYSNGVLHHTPDTSAVVREIHRVLRPGGHVIVMLYAERSLQYWRNLVWSIGVKDDALANFSMGEILSRSVERTANEARPLVKVYTKQRARALFQPFSDVVILQRQLLPEELPRPLRPWREAIERRFGWNLIVKARKEG